MRRRYPINGHPGQGCFRRGEAQRRSGPGCVSEIASSRRSPTNSAASSRSRSPRGLSASISAANRAAASEVSAGPPWSPNHAKDIAACDFFQSVTATFRVLYVFVAMEVGSRRILHVNVTDRPTAEWTIQQFREFLAFDHMYRFLVRDRDGIFSLVVDQQLRGFGVRVLKTPARTPAANCLIERLIGTTRRECLDYLIPFNERHLKRIVSEFVVYYNRGRPHSALGPGIPEPPQAEVPGGANRHQIAEGYVVKSTAALGGLHHEYRLEKEAA